MNKPATKEPSMDEILSSIRQIIADDDATAPRRPQTDFAAAQPAPNVADDTMIGFGHEPLTLSTAQIFGDLPEAKPTPIDFGSFLDDSAAGEDEAEDEVKEPTSAANFIDPEDITFEGAEPTPPLEPPPAFVRPIAPPPPAAARPAFMPPPARPRPSPAEAAPMPDADLSRDIAEQLLEPAAGASVRANFAKLNNLGLGNSNLTIEAMMREMLRPMLKEWLDEHLPTVVERMVEREISRISRGSE
jgi:cell pole-organizing protein PopZ